MIAAMRAGLGRRPALIPVPAALVALAARLIGREDAIGRLTGALEAAPDALLAIGWEPQVSTEEGLRRLAASPDA
jgi:UDP-glucose 4-epimerase